MMSQSNIDRNISKYKMTLYNIKFYKNAKTAVISTRTENIEKIYTKYTNRLTNPNESLLALFFLFIYSYIYRSVYALQYQNKTTWLLIYLSTTNIS